jgi:hypothetical protein
VRGEWARSGVHSPSVDTSKPATSGRLAADRARSSVARRSRHQQALRRSVSDHARAAALGAAGEGEETRIRRVPGRVEESPEEFLLLLEAVFRSRR